VTAAAPTATRGVTRQDVFAVLGALGAILTLITAVMFYFGWRRSDVQAREMSIDVSLFGFSSQDYVLRSISSLYLPVLVVFGLVLAWLWMHGHAVRLVHSELFANEHSRQRALVATRWVAAVAALVATSSVLFALAAGTRSPPWPVAPVAGALEDRQWVVPCVLVVATLTATYIRWIHRQIAPSGPTGGRPGPQAVLAALLLAGTVALGGFWMLEEYATAVGRGYAQDLAASVDALPRVTVLSPAPLSIEAEGVAEERVDVPGGSVRYRTNGLRLLARSGGKVLLLHDRWTPATGTVIVLADSDELVWQFSR
jgi:hypothetical protein